MVNYMSSDIELIEAQSRIWSLSYTSITKHCLKCAIDLGIPRIIHRHSPEPTSLPALLSALGLRRSKYDALRRLMRLLSHAGFFKLVVEKEEEECSYYITPASELLLDDDDGVDDEASAPPGHLFLRFDRDPVGVWSSLSEWFRNSDDVAGTAWEAVYGKPVWEWMAEDGDGEAVVRRRRFYDDMAGDSKLVARVLVSDYCKEIFFGVESLVDVGSGTGILSVAIAGAFPGVKCTAFDLPHVEFSAAAGLQANLDCVHGSMFDGIPRGQAILLKAVLHNWNDESCVKILTNCRAAVLSPSPSKKGKLILIEIVVGNEAAVGNDKDLLQLQLCFDMMMMTLYDGRERTEAEFNELFTAAGFSGYKIVRAIGVRSVIEVYP